MTISLLFIPACMRHTSKSCCHRSLPTYSSVDNSKYMQPISTIFILVDRYHIGLVSVRIRPLQLAHTERIRNHPNTQLTMIHEFDCRICIHSQLRAVTRTDTRGAATVTGIVLDLNVSFRPHHTQVSGGNYYFRLLLLLCYIPPP
jgi:hypothetical protein